MLTVFGSLELTGTFCFGFLIGWLVYYINRHRSGDVTLADLGVIVGVLAGGAITGLLSKEGGVNHALFGAYGLGLLAGFLSYLLVLLLLVRASKGEYDLLFFLDGRRKRPSPDYDTPPIGTVRPFVIGPSGNVRPFGRSAAGRPQVMSSTSGEITEAERKLLEALHAIHVAIIALDERRSVEPDNAKAEQISLQITTLHFKADVLAAEISKLRFASPAVVAARQKLGEVSDDLTDEAEKIKTATDVINQATKLISMADKVIGIVTGLV